MWGVAYPQASRRRKKCEPPTPATEPTKKNLAETNLGAGIGNAGSSNAHVGTAASAVQPERSSAMPGGACPGWYINREPFLDVIRMHRASVNNINKNNVPTALYESIKQCWDEARPHRNKHGYRNTQVPVQPPPRTIA